MKWLVDGEALQKRAFEIARDLKIDPSAEIYILIGEIQSGLFNVEEPEATETTAQPSEAEAEPLPFEPSKDDLEAME